MDKCGILYFDQNCVEEILGQNFMITSRKCLNQRISLGMNSICDNFQTIGAVPHGIEGTHYCQQNLSCTNIASRFVASDVLFASLQRQAECWISMRIKTLTN